MVDVKTEKGDETSTLVSKDASSHAVVVHSSVASYDVVTWLLLSVAIVVILVPGWLVATDPTLSTEEKRSTILILAASLVFSIVVFLLVLPKEFQLLSDASINVVTFVAIKWNFKGATAAYEGKSSPCSDSYRPKVKFATSFSKTIVVRRKNGAWDLLLSPVDPEAFVKAVFQVAAEKEEK